MLYYYDQGDYGKGQLTSITDADGALSSGYDKRGKLVNKINSITSLGTIPFPAFSPLSGFVTRIMKRGASWLSCYLYSNNRILTRVNRREAMKWDIFSSAKKGRKGTILDDMDVLIRRIEAFAPRKHRAERELFYYNYRMLKPYLDPLQRLLEVIAEGKKTGEQNEAIQWKLFTKLKDFYDPNKRLSLDEAIRDRGLKIKLRELFLFFYDIKDMTIPPQPPSKTLTGS